MEFGRLFEEEQARVGVHHVLNKIEIKINEEGGGDVVKEGGNVVKGGVNGKVEAGPGSREPCPLGQGGFSCPCKSWIK